ncbi:MAG: hypothetical protein SVX43_06975, partial [Cyanobacteriota bacterium]|nr:hypothetical protein [Cyanobacteriota bacterium]
MLYFIVAWTLLIIPCWALGMALIAAFGVEFKRRGDRAIVALWLGVFVLAAIFLAVSLIVSLSPLVGAAIAFGLTLVSLRS